MTDLRERITVEEGKGGGKPCIRVMRIRVMDILDMMAGGMAPEQILEDFPYLEREDITASLACAALAVNAPAHAIAVTPAA
ncbi:MAG TPA: hypothetical protein DCL54_00845 [Alphaproteobacteria bacterium]|nr:hypothetical protein [Alphaproteobacteria bacterium]HAJ45113.1 hypothetical protein [Alphaproteobacteria bacterium]